MAQNGGIIQETWLFTKLQSEKPVQLGTFGAGLPINPVDTPGKLGFMIDRSFEESVRLLEDRINLERLQSFGPQEMEGRLDILRDILASLDDPEMSYRTVHVAGTKGKGSTCVMLESILLNDGWRVGRYTSPHLYSFTERLLINGVPCPPDEYTELFFSVYEKIDPDTLQSLTYFELLTLLAFVYFAQKKVDVAIVEVGLGGRLDATNVCQPDVSVITSISYDHLMQLGPTLSDIAREKSGIIKTDVPVVTTVLHPEAQEVIRDRAKSLGSPLFVLNEHFFIRRCDLPEASRYAFRYDALPPEFPVELSLDNVTLRMPGGHQIRNASAAISAFLLLHHTDPTFEAAKVREGLQHSFLPLRGEVFRPSDDSPVLMFDGAHNRSSIRALVKTISELFPCRRRLLVFGTSIGKDVEGMYAEINRHFHHIFLTQSSDSSRRFPPQGLRSILALNPDQYQHNDQKDDDDFLDPSVSLLPDTSDVVVVPLDVDREMNGVTVVEDCKEALTQCLRMADSKDIICITGSLYLTAELRKWFLEQAAQERGA